MDKDRRKASCRFLWHFFFFGRLRRDTAERSISMSVALPIKMAQLAPRAIQERVPSHYNYAAPIPHNPTSYAYKGISDISSKARLFPSYHTSRLLLPL
ncbi:hypothetical protein Scep_010964 [Stephania cephalantha]|uniref:Uncharacterized protein n=1 Tax=Stephania cephalantha TaxID=152367 RepID=A0AAP0JW53_9MAGN